MEDLLDRSDFNPVDYINEYFPTESSLDILDTYLVGLNSKIATLDEEISKSVQVQSSTGQQATKEIQEAQSSINELFTKIQDIKLKASQSEKMVHEICADIKRLDYAKNHLQSSITALKRLQMLVTAVGKLETLAEEFQYREVANLLDAVKQLISHFEQYLDVPMIKDLRHRVDVIQTDLQTQVHKAFREIGQLVDSVADVSVIMQSLPGHLRSLPDACLVVDALGPFVRKQLLAEFVKLQLVPYEQTFGPERAHYNLEEVDRRWAWFKRLLRSVDTKFSNLCPSHWRLPLRLCLEFIMMTRSHLESLLTQLESKDAMDVSQLLKALQTALRFEQEMNIQFEPVFNQAGLPKIRPLSGHKSSIETSVNQQTSNVGGEDEETEFLLQAQSALKGGISNGFDRFLGSYVVLEKNNLEDMLKRLSQEEDIAQTANMSGETSSSSSGNVFGSSISMFVFIKNSIKRCTALTTGQTFLSLTKEFKSCMQQYADMLRNRCPPLIPQTAPPGGLVGYVPQPLCKLVVGQESLVCYIINTGEYCAEVVPQLEQLIKSKMAETYREKVDLSSEVDVFTDLMSLGLKAAIGGALDRLEPAFRTMQFKNWANDAQVGEESAYVLQMDAVLKDLIPKIRECLSSTYFNSLCTRLATEILLKYHDAIMRQKAISEAGSQQLLLDAYNLKTLLLRLHSVGASPSGSDSSSNRAPPSVYSKFVLGRASQIETVLKLVGTPSQMLIERFRIMWPEGKMEDLTAIMTLKGIRRSDQQALLDSQPALVGPLSANANQSSNTGGSSLGASLFSLDAAGGAAVMASSVRTLTQDISTSAITSLSAVGSLKWGK